jgi:hypothetical protein
MPGLVPGIHVFNEIKAWMASGLPDFRIGIVSRIYPTCSDKHGHDRKKRYALIFCTSASDTSKLA